MDDHLMKYFLTKNQYQNTIKANTENINPNYPGGGAGRNYFPLSENLNFSGTEPPFGLRPVCKFKFVRCGPEEKKQSALSFSV